MDRQSSKVEGEEESEDEEESGELETGRPSDSFFNEENQVK
jgi:hypothetical protein